MNATAKLFAAIQDFPESTLAEVVDFAEFLRAKNKTISPHSDDALLTTLSGGLENSQTFAADATTLQARLRDEWN